MQIKQNNLTLEGFERIQEVVMRLKLEKTNIPKCGVTIDLAQEIKDGRGDYHWYGGLVATISLKDSQYRVVAIGDVMVKLLNKNTNEEITKVNDMKNSGAFFDIMKPYIENDTHLYEILENRDPKYALVFSKNNRFEVFRDRIKGIYDDEDSYVSDWPNIFDVIVEAVEAIIYDYPEPLEEE